MADVGNMHQRESPPDAMGRRLRRRMWLFPLSASLLWAALLEFGARHDRPDTMGRTLLAALVGTIASVGFWYWIMTARAPGTTQFWRIRWLVIQFVVSAWILCTFISPAPLSSLRPTADDFMRAVEKNHTWRARAYLAIGFEFPEPASANLPEHYRLSVRRSFYERALTAAARHGDLALVKAIWPLGSEVDAEWQAAVGYKRRIPWLSHDALRAAADSGHWDVVFFLRSRGITDDAVVMGAAASAGAEPILRRLLDEGANPSMGLVAAARAGRGETVEFLLEAGAEPAAGLTAACESGQLEIARLLLDAGADPQGPIAPRPEQPTIANTPFMAAIRENRLEIVEELIRRGVDVNLWGTYEINEKSWLPTVIQIHPLAYARKLGRLEIADRIVAAGANESLRSEQPAPRTDSDDR